MSTFSTGNWLQNLQGLFGQGGQQQGSNWTATQRPTVQFPTQGITGAGSSFMSADPFGGSPTYTPRYFQQGVGQQGGFMPTYGQALAGGALADFQRGEQARQQELGMYMGLLGNLMGSMQGAGQMVQDARQAGQQGMQLVQQQAGNIREAANQGREYFDIARGQMERSLGEARSRFDQGIGTLRESRAGFDAGRRDDTATQVMGIQAQYQNEMDNINRRDDLTAEQKQIMTDELKQKMRQQSTSLAAQADAQARQTMLALDQNIASMQAGAAQGLGTLGVGVGQALGQLGMQTAAQRQQAEETIGNFYNNMQQYNTSMLQGAQAAALNYVLQGNQAMASIINASPFGPTSIFGTIAHMIQAVDEDRSRRMSPQMGQIFGGLR